MTDRIPVLELQRLVRSPSELNGQTFSVLRELCALTNSTIQSDNAMARDLTIRILDEREQIDEQYQDLLSSLVRTHGLFPYLNSDSLRSESDLLAYESHRPEGMDEWDIVFHRVQGAIYYYLLDGQNVILSAPTSFGKSLIIDALLASGRYNNVVIVVPTLALIDETRRRLSQRFGDTFKVITHPGQNMEDKNIFVYTQERVVDQDSFPKVDLFVIDEFYKLDSSDEERTGLLNQALYRLLKTGAQFYFLGPNIERIAEDLPSTFNARFFQTDFSTVAIDVETVQKGSSDIDSLVALCSSLEESTLIYCRSPRQTRDVAQALLEAGFLDPEPKLDEAASWIADNYDPEWLVGRALGRGVGIHNGRIPRSLAQLMVREFNGGNIRFLVCTSTLIEGVNTAAKNVVVYSDRIGRNQRFDYFTFNNIRGRSGRMFRHFVGHVYLFHPAPQPQLPLVDIPVLSQPPTAPSSLLVQLDPEDLTLASSERLQPILAQSDLTVETIRENKGVSPELQIEVAAEIHDRAIELHPLIAWSGLPTWDQLRATCELIWKLSGFSGRIAGVSSGSQMALKLNRLARNPETSQYIEALSQNDSEADGDERVESALEFVRQWAGHHAPRLFQTLNSIQKEVFESIDYRSGNYGFYIGRLQNMFLPSPIATVDEYGLPSEVALRIQSRLALGDDLDALLESIRSLDVDSLPITGFERRLVSETQQSLGPRRRRRNS